ncbi:TetR/AcrR family transcriptional regulator [Salininema proteolyticum]|uniref:TetR/AcrR family transcriptional regulator n=1 Tax=Salininema proteolyticum TaxID=1607685 RepID=A0ABV8U3T5_9ACTN
MTPTSAERGRDARERLLTAAAELIPELGWNAVSTRVLAERAGVRPGLVHYHFSSLSELLRLAALQVIRQTMDMVGLALSQIDSPEDAVDAMLAQLDAFSGLDPTSVLFAESYLQATRDPELREQFRETTVAFETTVSAFFARHGVDSPGAALTFMAALDGFVLHKALNPDLRAADLAPSLKSILDTERRRT